jgi:hypothetical protein
VKAGWRGGVAQEADMKGLPGWAALPLVCVGSGGLV